MEERFYLETVQRLLGEGWLRRDDAVLVVAGDGVDREVMAAAGLRDVTICNLDTRVRGADVAPYRWSLQDAERLSFPDGAFDVCIAHQGLHHCRSPHRGLLEMYRVARRGVLFFEPQETLLTQLGVRLGIGQRYEVAAVGVHGLHAGGVANSEVPNFVYRWSEREVRKVLASYDPVGAPRVRCFYDLRIPEVRIARLRHGPARVAAQAAVPLARAALRLAPRQANAMAVAVDKLDVRRDRHPWLAVEDGRPVPDRHWFASRYALHEAQPGEAGGDAGGSGPDEEEPAAHSATALSSGGAT